MMTKADKKTRSFLVALGTLLLGGIIGIGFGLLVAPRSGEKTRKLIRKKSTKIKDQSVDSLKDSRDQALESLDSLTKDAKSRANAVASSSKELMERQKANAQEKLGAIR